MHLKSVLPLFAFASLAFATPAEELHERQDSQNLVQQKCYCCQQAVQAFWFFKGAGTGCRECPNCGPGDGKLG